MTIQLSRSRKVTAASISPHIAASIGIIAELFADVTGQKWGRRV
jgi:hypothetical protein